MFSYDHYWKAYLLSIRFKAFNVYAKWWEVLSNVIHQTCTNSTSDVQNFIIPSIPPPQYQKERYEYHILVPNLSNRTEHDGKIHTKDNLWCTKDCEQLHKTGKITFTDSTDACCIFYWWTDWPITCERSAAVKDYRFENSAVMWKANLSPFKQNRCKDETIVQRGSI